MGLFDELDAVTGSGSSKDEIIKAPFGWPGGKSKSVKHILPHLPYTTRYVEPFGGSFAIGLARKPCKMEVYNDRYGGLVSFYRVIRNPKLYNELIDRLELTIHSREEFVFCKETWENVQDDVERAARWYYMIEASFSCLGRNWGRSLSPAGRMAGKINSKLELFSAVHKRMRRVQVENQDWWDCINDYDHYDTVFYIDPPYIDAYKGIYKHELRNDQYAQMISTIFNSKAFVALSGYSGCPILEDQDWDERHEWDINVTIESVVQSEGNKKAHLNGVSKRGKATEVLWIKHSK